MKNLFLATLLASTSITVTAQCRVYTASGKLMGTMFNRHYTPPGHRVSDDTDYYYSAGYANPTLEDPDGKAAWIGIRPNGILYNIYDGRSAGRVIGNKFYLNNKLAAYGNEVCSRNDVYAVVVFYSLRDSK